MVVGLGAVLLIVRSIVVCATAKHNFNQALVDCIRTV